MPANGSKTSLPQLPSFPSLSNLCPHDYARLRIKCQNLPQEATNLKFGRRPLCVFAGSWSIQTRCLVPDGTWAIGVNFLTLWLPLRWLMGNGLRQWPGISQLNRSKRVADAAERREFLSDSAWSRSISSKGYRRPSSIKSPAEDLGR